MSSEISLVRTRVYAICKQSHVAFSFEYTYKYIYRSVMAVRFSYSSPQTCFTHHFSCMRYECYTNDLYSTVREKYWNFDFNLAFESIYSGANKIGLADYYEEEWVRGSNREREKRVEPINWSKIHLLLISHEERSSLHCFAQCSL